MQRFLILKGLATNLRRHTNMRARLCTERKREGGEREGGRRRERDGKKGERGDGYNVNNRDNKKCLDLDSGDGYTTSLSAISETGLHTSSG